MSRIDLAPARPRNAAALTLALLTFGVAVPSTAAAQYDATTLPTRAEATNWIETSRYADVVAFLETLAASSDLAHLETMGYTTEGRAIPLLVVGRGLADGSPEAVRATGKVRVYLQGNIHGGEVPGKEALQMLMRDLLAGRTPAWLDDMVLLVAPLYNADGNERVDLSNRPRQHGPIGGMGQRPNAEGYDLNRDHMKVDSPEARSVIGMMNRYDPHVSVDLHTTNGSHHAYWLTYSPPLHPGTDAGIDALLRDEAFPRITETIRRTDGQEFWYYGNASNRGGEAGWYTFDHRPRFNNNYIGLRNRIAILSEAYAYATFEERAFSTRRFVEEILNWVADEGDAIAATVAAADASVVGETLPLRAVPKGAAEMSTILMGEVAQERHPYTGETILRRLDVVTPTPMREYGSFEGTVFGTVPQAYVIPANIAPAIDRMLAHGVELEWIEPGTVLRGETFAIDSSSVAPREFQGHFERELFGEWSAAEITLPEGGWRVDASAPLGRLSFYLLEPRSDDGLANWALLDRYLEDGVYPIHRIPAGG